MAKDILTEYLESIFENVNTWVKFAEAKNVALLTLDAAAIFGLLRLYSSYQPQSSWVVNAMAAAIALLFISLVICLSSFFARTKVSRILFARPPRNQKNNLFFFNDLAGMEEESFLMALTKSTAYQGEVHPLHRDIANQIIVNSRVARKKYALFNAALWVTMATIITPVGAIVFYWMLNEETI